MSTVLSTTTKKYIFIIIITALTGLFAYGSFLGLTKSQPQASLTVEQNAYELQQRIEKLFPRDSHTVPYMVFADGSNTDVLTKNVLQSVLKKSNGLRNSDFGKKYLVNFQHPSFGQTDHLGFFSIADAVNSNLQNDGLTLSNASDEEFNRALDEIFADSQYKNYFKLTTSEELEYTNGKWRSPAFQFYVQADNDLLGVGVFRRTVGSTEQLLQKEQFNRDVESMFQPLPSNAEFLGIGVDLNLEAQDEGYSFGVLVRNALLIVTLAILTGAIMNSWRIGIVALFGLSILFIWILGFPVLTGDLVKSSLMTRVILPLAFMAIGIDFYIYTVNEYEKKRSQANGSQKNITNILIAFSTVSTALILAGISDAIAFGANYMSAAEAVRSFAITGTFSAFAAFILMSIFSPVILSVWDDHQKRVSEKAKLSIKAVLRKVLKYKKVTIVSLLLITGIAAFGVFDIQKGLTPEDFISSKSSFVKSIDINDRHWTNTRGERASIIATGNIDSTKAKEALKKVTNNLRDNEHLAHHPTTNELVLPLGTWQIKQINENKKAALIVVEITDTRNLTTIQEVGKELDKDINPLKEVVNDYGITGSPFTREASLTAVTDSLSKTFGVAILLIFFVLLAAFRSVKFSLICLSPITLVTLWTFGFMGIANFDLNFITATIAAASLGLGIDYAIHIVQSFRQKYQKHGRGREAILHVADSTMVASFTAFVSSVAGFLILATAPMPMFATYGILGAAMITFAFVNVVTLLPLLLLWSSHE